MKKNEACEFLTKIASSELIDDALSKEIYKARDIVVCKEHTVLDVLASDETRRIYRQELVDLLFDMTTCRYLSLDTKKKARELFDDLRPESSYSEKCTKMYLPTRCKNCPNYCGD